MKKNKVNKQEVRAKNTKGKLMKLDIEDGLYGKDKAIKTDQLDFDLPYLPLQLTSLKYLGIGATNRPICVVGFMIERAWICARSKGPPSTRTVNHFIF